MASNVITSCFLLLALFCMFHYSAANHEKKQHQKLSSAIVVGTVNCDISSFSRDLSKSSHFISGASVAVECADGATGPSFRKEIKTNHRGVFRARLPTTGVDFMKGCYVRLIRSSEPFCSMASSSATSAELRHLESKRNGRLQVFTVGHLAFKPLAPPRKFASPVAERKQFLFPPQIPLVPPPSIPFVPSPPALPPNPLVPPPSLVPPVVPSPPPSLLPPVVPSPPPSLLPPVVPTPPPAPAIGIPPLPLPTPPSSPPPPAPTFPPLPPNPLIPGHPPASPAAKTSP